MIRNTLVRKAVQVEYSILRAPLAIVNRGLASRLARDSKVRLTVERGLGSLDAVAGQLLSKPSSAQRNGHRDHKPEPSRAAADVPADGNVESTHEEAEVTHEDAVERVAEEILEEQEQKPVTGELADPELQEVQAEVRAKHLVEEYEEEQQLKREHAERVQAADAAKKAPAEKSAAKKAPAKKSPAKKSAGS
jgi:hypothetical protein